MLDRRSFLRVGAAAAGAAAIVRPRRATALAPSDELRIASIGVGNMGGADLGSVSTAKHVRIAALCDVNAVNLGNASKKFPAAKTFGDWRKLFDEMRDEIDAVTVSTPDHMHGPIALAAMELGKHVYCQKPLAHNLAELRAMGEMATAKQVVTQMGTQCHGMSEYRTAAKMLRDGAIGKVSEIHTWIERVWAGPPEGRPATSAEPPATLDWDLWLGVAPVRPFVPEIYTPMTWRGWRDFGTGTLGDMGCHIFDPLFTGLELGAPIEAVWRGQGHHAETFAADSDVTLTFAGTPYTAERVTLRWTDGKTPHEVAKAQLPPDVQLPGGGSFCVGEKGVMALPHVGAPSFYASGKPMEIEVENVPGVDHYHQWADACRGEGKTEAPFSYGCLVTEAVLTGVVAGAFQDVPIKWDSAKLEFDLPEANELVRRSYRTGWEVAGV
jgi:predicted dehydrogenase